MAEENKELSEFCMIDIFTTDELVDALLSRCDHAIIALFQVDTADGDDLTIEWQGDATMCKGLTHDVIEHIAEESYEPEFDELDDD